MPWYCPSCWTKNYNRNNTFCHILLSPAWCLYRCRRSGYSAPHHCIVWHPCIKWSIKFYASLKTNIGTLDYDCFMSEIIRLWPCPTGDRKKGSRKKTPFKGQGKWRWCEYSCMTHWSNLALVLSQPTSNGDQLHPCQALKSDPANGPKYIFAFHENVASLGIHLITDIRASEKRCKWLPRTSQHYFLLATQMIPLVKERFLTFPPLSPKPHSCPTPLIHLSVLALFPVLMSWGQIAVMELLSCSQPISNSAFSSDLVANNLPDSLSMLSQFLELVKVKYESPF